MNLASTRNRPRAAVGNPSMVLKERSEGGVIVELQRNSPNAGEMVSADLDPLRRLVKQAEGEAESLSHGPLTVPKLRALGHPYGKGARPNGKRRRGLGRIQGGRKGISNRDIVNEQSGELAGAWSSGVMRNSKGALLFLANSAPQSRFVAFGTPAMVAHGPFEKVMRRRLPAINREWQAAGRIAAARKRAAERLASLGSLSLNDLSFGAMSQQGPSVSGIQRAYALGFQNTEGAAGELE